MLKKELLMFVYLKELSKEEKMETRKLTLVMELWKYAQTVGPVYLGAPTHPGAKKEVKVYADI